MEFDDSLLEHLAAIGYRPEFGARELRRVIRSELETRLARAMLGGEIHDGDRVRVRWDRGQHKVTFDIVGGPAEHAEPAREDVVEEAGRESFPASDPPAWTRTAVV